MTAQSESYRKILFATWAVGGASVVSILLGIVRLKAAALVLGTAGIGLLGLLQSVISTGAAIGGLGIGQSATRQVAAARAEGGDRLARRALFTATAALALVSALLVWVFRRPIAELLLDGAGSAQAVGWMGLAVGLTIVTSSQTALLAGLGRVADVARVSLFTACLSTVAAIAFLLLLGDRAIVPYLLAVPAAGALAGWFYAARAERPSGPAAGGLTAEWRKLAGLGAAIMVSAVIVNLSQLGVRGLLSQRVGMAELGLYQAAATISVTYLGFVLQAITADFYPRLSALPARSAEADRLVNEQTEMALLMGGPVILAMMGMADSVLALLFTGEFSGGAGLLRWMVFGDILRIASWPLGFALLASGRGRIFVILEVSTATVFTAVTYLLLPVFGVEAAALGFVAMYLFYLPLVFLVLRSQTSFRWSRAVWRDLLLLIAGGAVVLILAAWSSFVAAAVGVGMASLWFAFGFHRLRHLLPAGVLRFLPRSR